MDKANVIFSLDGDIVTIQCLKKDKMRNICQRYSTKVDKNINSLSFLYSGSLLNLDLSFERQANPLDNQRNEMKVLVFINESDGFICPKCGEKIKLNTEKIDAIITSINNIKDTIDGTKIIIDNIIKNSTLNSINVQLKNTNIILNNVNTDIKKCVEKLKDLLSENDYKINPNFMNVCNNQQQINNMNNFNMNMPNLNMNNQKSSLNLKNIMNLNVPNNYQNRGKQKNESPFTTSITYPHKAGLFNIGKSSYMNATIECLSNIKSLSNNLLQKYGYYNIDKQPLCVSYSCLLYDLLCTTEKYINPKLFKEIIGKLNPLFEGYHVVDPKDLIFFIIETLHKELCPFSSNNNNEIDFLQQELISQNEQKMLNDLLKEMQSNSTIISNLFYGINRSIMKCIGCNITKYSFWTFNLLIFPLKKVKDYKMRKYGGGWFNNNLDLNLYDSFECEQEVERLEGDYMIYYME